jgi:alkylhydroperoxidase/carboxymuconolactone decarboxylase family protein YurZ
MKLVIKKDIKNIINNDDLLLCYFVSCLTSNKNKYLQEIMEILKKNRIEGRKVYETILQAYLFCGFPATIESMKKFNTVYKNFRKPEYSYNLSKYLKSGLINCKIIYRSNFDKLMDNFSNLSDELKGWMIIEGYGKVMGRKGLSLKTRELINTAILSTNFYEHQLFSHIKGCLNTGSNVEEIKNVIEITKSFGGKVNSSKSMKLLENIMKSCRL